MGNPEKNGMYAPPPGPPPSATRPPPQSQVINRTPQPHTNALTRASALRARDEQDMVNLLQQAQMAAGIYNQEVEPEHETEYVCGCLTCQYRRRKLSRLTVQSAWSDAVMYPGEKHYSDVSYSGFGVWKNPYARKVVSPFGNNWTRGGGSGWGYIQRPIPSYHTQFILDTIALNNQLNKQAQAAIDAAEPKDLWEEEDNDTKAANGSLNGTSNGDYKGDSKRDVKGEYKGDVKGDVKPSATPAPAPAPPAIEEKKGKFSSFKKALGVGTSSSNTDDSSGGSKTSRKQSSKNAELRNAILLEETSRWPDQQWRNLVVDYQAKVGMTAKVAELRRHQPIQYFHLLRAGYWEPIPVHWATLNSNPLKFSIESAGGWRGITPSWRGFEDTAEERLYYILNHRDGAHGAVRLKPDFISEMNMALDRMASAVEPPPQYFSSDDTCHLQHTSAGYSKQVMPRQFHAYDRPENPADDTMILLDVSGSMDFDPVRPVYNQYLIQNYVKSTQPKNKDVAKAIIRRFIDAMANHDHNQSGYDLVTFSSSASYVGAVAHHNLDQVWGQVRIGGGTRVMTGWQQVKELHFQKHSESAIRHPIYGWQAGPETPMLRLLLLLDGEATDMDEFELDLLGLNWAHVTIFLIGVDGCPHHHRHANELQRISDVNHHVSFVDAQGNTPERFVTHELLKRHLGYDVPMQEFEQLEQLPAYRPV